MHPHKNGLKTSLRGSLPITKSIGTQVQVSNTILIISIYIIGFGMTYSCTSICILVFLPGLGVRPENASQCDRGGVPLLRLAGHPLDPRHPTPCAVPLRHQQPQELEVTHLAKYRKDSNNAR